MKGLHDKLTGREQEILQLLMAGMTNKEIGRELNISPRTVESHINNVILKTGARNRVNMVALVILKRMVAVTVQELESRQINTDL